MTSASQSRVSVVICTHAEERWHDLERAVQSLRDQSESVHEIIVVVDHDPALLSRVRDAMPDVVGVANDGRPGLGGGRNSGIQASSGEIIAFMDDDAVATSEWCHHMLSAYKDPRVAGTGGSIEPLFETRRPNWFPQEFDWVIGCTYRGLPHSAAPVRNLFGANMSFRRRVLIRAGTFRLGYGCDETEFCIRLRRMFPDAILLYNPPMKILHRVPTRRGRLRYFLRRCYFEGGSKAVVAHLWGTSHGLESERAYTLHTLPGGVARGIADAMVRGDVSGLQRAGAIVVGLAVTTAGYLKASISRDKSASERGWVGILERQVCGEGRS